MNASELVQECFRRTGIHRSDLNALADFIETRESGQLDALRTVRLFWETWNPRAMVAVASVPVGNTDEEPPSLPDELEAEHLEILAGLEQECRVYYEPDSETAIDHRDASIYAHVGAASALSHRKRDGLSDDVTRTLDDVRKTLYRGNYGGFMESDTGETISLSGVRAIVLSLQAQVRYRDTKYGEAFEMALSAFRELRPFETMYEPEDFLKELLMEDWLGEGVDEEELEEEIERDFEVRREIRIGDPLTILDPQLMVDAFEGLKRQGKCDDWQALARNCDYLAIASSAELNETRVFVGDEPDITWNYRLRKALSEVPILEGDVAPHGFREKWQDYWIRAKGWAAAQLSPNEYREMRRQDDEDASEQRLRRYFFGDIWEKLPEKTRESLVNVDNLWFSAARGTNVGSVLNELQVAAETMCYQYIWEPLRQTQGGQAVLAFKARDAGLRDKGFFPTLSDYTWACRRPLFRILIDSANLDKDDRQFMNVELRRALTALRKPRDDIQHDPSIRMQRRDVEPFVRRFLGIGQEGVLRRLGEIGPKLACR
ncbi:MAG: hypothetical protein OYI31_00670 [Chloroflexota bacterium]|nr:hypothetical protein [Chloroflexota bacterium]MDE2940785.1 hypothetical protein [Chloroflexota bacterium]MDE3266967.1 hypothetical protein [Chloroflexota bacterium]